MPFSIATPKTAMNPIADGTETYCPVTNRPMMPPMIAKGTLAMMIVACRSELNAVYSKRKISPIVSGTIRARRASARCWFSKAPPHSTQ